MSERDPFAQLRAVNPLSALEVTKDNDARLLAEIVATPLSQRRKPRHWWWIGTGIVLATASATTYALLRSEPARNPTTISCYSNATIPPDDQVALGAEADPVAACTQVWATGQLGRGDVPQLTACVTAAGLVAVIPGDDQVCGQLGYVLWNGITDVAAQAIIDFQNDITETLGPTCYPADQAFQLTTDAMTRHGLGDWTLASNENWSDTAPCTQINVDPDAMTITLGSRQRFPTDKDPPG